MEMFLHFSRPTENQKDTIPESIAAQWIPGRFYIIFWKRAALIFYRGYRLPEYHRSVCFPWIPSQYVNTKCTEEWLGIQNWFSLQVSIRRIKKEHQTHAHRSWACTLDVLHIRYYFDCLLCSQYRLTRLAFQKPQKHLILFKIGDPQFALSAQIP